MKQHATIQQEGSAASQDNTQAVGSGCQHPEPVQWPPSPGCGAFFSSPELNNLLVLEVSYPTDPFRDTLRVLQP